MISDERLKAIEASWGPARPNGHLTPPAHVAREQVLELVAEVKRQRGVHANPVTSLFAVKPIVVNGMVTTCHHDHALYADGKINCAECGKPWRYV